jgi:hypothetical protein
MRWPLNVKNTTGCNTQKKKKKLFSEENINILLTALLSGIIDECQTASHSNRNTRIHSLTLKN